MDEKELNNEVVEQVNPAQVNVQPTEQVERKVDPPTEVPKEEKPKNNKRRILLLLLLLIATGFLLATTTYAWFTSNRTVTVGDINVNVATSGGIQISVDAANWKSLVSTTELNGVGAANTSYVSATNQIPATTSALQPVSTALTSLTKDTSTHEDPLDDTSPLLDKRNDNGYLSMWLGTVKSNAGGQYILTTSDVSDVSQRTNGGYFVCFDLFFKVDAETSTETTGTQKQIYLTTSSDVKTSGTDTGIKNAARVAFIKEGAVESGAAKEDAQALKTTTVADNIVLWEPNADKHTASGVNNAVNVYGVNANSISAGTGNSPLSYSGVINKVIESDDITLGAANATAHSSQFAAVPPTGVTIFRTNEDWGTSANGVYRSIFTLGANQITKMKIYFWVEGQDVDCENNASGGSITLSLQFSLNDQAQS